MKVHNGERNLEHMTKLIFSPNLQKNSICSLLYVNFFGYKFWVLIVLSLKLPICTLNLVNFLNNSNIH